MFLIEMWFYKYEKLFNFWVCEKKERAWIRCKWQEFDKAHIKWLKGGNRWKMVNILY